MESGDGIEIEETANGIRIINSGENSEIYTRDSTFPDVADAEYDRLYSEGTSGKNNRLGYLRHQNQKEMILSPESWGDSVGFHDGEHDFLHLDEMGLTRGELLPATANDDGDLTIGAIYQNGHNLIVVVDSTDLRWHEGGGVANAMWIFTWKESDASATIATTNLSITQDREGYRVFRRNNVAGTIFEVGKRYHVSFRLGGSGEANSRVTLHDGSHVVRLVDDVILGGLEARVLALEEGAA